MTGLPPIPYLSHLLDVVPPRVRDATAQDRCHDPHSDVVDDCVRFVFPDPVLSYPVLSCQREFESIFDKNSAILDVPLETFDESNVEPLMPGSVRTEIPVFMLDVSACPGGVVPLHIFEMRYRQVSVVLN